MKLSSLISPNLVKCGLTARTKEDALREVVEHLSNVDATLRVDELLQALTERERLGPFSTSKGAAFPHARTEKVDDFTVVLGTSAEGIDFKARDGHKIEIIVLFVIPKKHSNLYLHVLAQFLNVFAHEDQTAKIVAAKTPEELIQAIDESPAQGPSPTGSIPTRIIAPATVTSVTPEATLGKVVELFLQKNMEALPVIDSDGNLCGEVLARSLMDFGVQGHLSSLSKVTSLASRPSSDNFLRTHWETSLRDIPGLISENGFPVVQEDLGILESVLRLRRAQRRTGYRLKGRRLTGIIDQIDLLRRMSGKE